MLLIPAKTIVRKIGRLAKNRIIRAWQPWARLRISSDIIRFTTQGLRSLRNANVDRPFCGIFLVEHLGDIIACEPVVGWVANTYPNAFITWVVKPQYQSILRSHPRIDNVETVPSLAHAAPLIKSGIFDHVIDLHVNEKPTGVGYIRHIKNWGDPSITLQNYGNHGPHLQSFAKAAGIDIEPIQPKLFPAKDSVACIDSLNLPSRFVAIHTTSNEKNRNWTAEGWQSVVAHILKTTSLHVVEVGLNPTIHLTHPRFLQLCGHFSVQETSEVIRRASYFMGVDSSVAHMANAHQRPGTILMGNYLGFKNFMPYTGYYRSNESDCILQHRGELVTLSIETVIERLRNQDSWKKLVVC